MAQFLDEHSYSVDIDGGPMAPDGWKRAVYRQPPKHFSIEMLPPEKQGSAYAYGMRICPMQKDDDRSSSSGGSHSEYEIWRRWDDCLWFQDCFEMEYEQMSRAKRKRLAAGKGVKKNGVYIQKDQASSFVSLPPGPDPHSVAKNIHDYVPKLTKKGVLFRANQATIDQRYQELTACIEGLFQEGAPMLIQELRESQKVTDFFGYWRRDFDLALKQQKGKGIEKQPRTSISSSVFETYFSSTPNLATTEATLVNPPGGKSHKSPAGKVATPVKFNSKSSKSDDDFYPHRGSSGSTSSVGPPSPSSTLYAPPSSYIVPHDIPVVFGHKPMESLPEGEELAMPMSGMNIARRSKSVSPMSRGRSATAYGRNAEPASFDANEELPANSVSNRLSSQSRASVLSIDPASYLAELETDFTLPKCPSAVSEFPRGSVASFATFMTDSSADAIIPLSPESDHRRLFSTDSTRTRTLSDAESSLPNPDEDLDSYFDATFGHPMTPTSESCPPSRPETPVGELPSSMSLFSSHSSSSRGSRSSRARSRSSTLSDFTSSDSSSVSGDGSISVKVVHNTSIILLRINRSISFADLRAKVYDKFIQQEGVPLSASFALAFLPPAPIDYNKPRSRSSSVSSVGFPDLVHMRFISSEREWQHAIALTGRGKLTLRAIGDQGF
ncbi:hypothetical protein PILCRDRAFT_817790 [Piloderma croceum F 1598]|uniref:PX domain-containing protein n=1 Tax=Piloderma croceum (strain F 1598) TaxID=765440 RepID=A0A0C3G2T2_PILCF|nr:hypothetical protein PILCRDRAFT_817790 [Piloderma croceum F 1598]